MTSTVDVLIAARKLIEKEEDWCQGAFDSGGARCAAEAMIVASGDAGVDYYLVRDALKEAIGAPDLVHWNDSHGRTHADILAGFDAAIAAERVKESA